jgi:hypothetical protein
MTIKNIMDERNNVFKKENEYKDYINEHVGNVKRAYDELFVKKEFPILTSSITDDILVSITPEEMREAIEEVAIDIENHDKSKWGNIEFYAYRRKFHPTDKEKEEMKNNESYANTVKKDFEKAWQHHYTHNNHHPQYWAYRFDKPDTLLDKPKDMPLTCIIHMISDWCGMSIKFDGGLSCIDWYKNRADKEKKLLSPKTKKTVEIILNYLFNENL